MSRWVWLTWSVTWQWNLSVDLCMVLHWQWELQVDAHSQPAIYCAPDACFFHVRITVHVAGCVTSCMHAYYLSDVIQTFTCLQSSVGNSVTSLLFLALIPVVFHSWVTITQNCHVAAGSSKNSVLKWNLQVHWLISLDFCLIIIFISLLVSHPVT
jgi:hypothetical protein